MRNCVLIIEKDINVAHFIQGKLEEADFTCLVDYSGEAAVDLAGQKQVDVIILDSDSLDIEGSKLISDVRAVSSLPIVVISSDADVEKKVQLFESGVDDYLVKPYSTKELVARIHALLRRHKEPQIVVDPSFNIQDLYIYPERHEVRIGENVIELTKKEFDLLLFLVKNKNRVLKRDEIMKKVWGYEYSGKTNIVDVYIRYIRSKIDEKFGKKYVHTVRGIGYVVRD